MIRIVIVLLLCFPHYISQEAFAAAGGGGGNGSLSSPPVAKQTPEQKAVKKYFRGIKLRDKALALELKAQSEQNEKKHKKLLKKAQKKYLKAEKQFVKALKKLPGAYEIYSDLGFVYRKTGQLEKSLATYNLALQLKPDYAPALEYRGEAYLQMANVQKAKDAYMSLFRIDRKNAAVLLSAMQVWVDSKPDSISAEELTVFSEWLAARTQIDQQTSDLSSPDASSWTVSSTE